MGDMQTDTMINTLLAAAGFLKRPFQDVAAQPLKDAYEAAKIYLRKKFDEGSGAAKALELATEKPESLIRKALLVEESASVDLESDPEVARIIERLAVLVPESPGIGWQNVRVNGQGNHVQVAGRDIVTTEKHVQRNAITPDERHLTAEQREKIRSVIAEVAERLAVKDGEPNLAAVHRMVQRRFNVASYLLVPQEKYGDALSFLKQQRAIHRSRLRHRDPAAYQNDFFRAIYAGAGELGWDRLQVYQFAVAKLGLKKPVTSLKQLGPFQLKSLAEFVRQQVAHMREKR
jgi:hypothetical protein